MIHSYVAHFEDTFPVAFARILGSEDYHDYMSDTLVYEGKPE